MKTPALPAILMSLLFACLLAFTSGPACAGVLDQEQATVRATVGVMFEAKSTPSSMRLVEDGYLNLTMYSEQCAEISIASNSPYSVKYRTLSGNGKIMNGIGYSINTYYYILPPGSPQPKTVFAPGRIKGADLRTVAQSPDSQNEYRKLLCVVAAQDPLEAILQNIVPYNLRLYTDTVFVTAESSGGGAATIQIAISYDPFQ
ncbi:MAG: hypothetical protein WC291_12165 [Thermodesulfovibrionales bacterium]|jgi:hypothetical protein